MATRTLYDWQPTIVNSSEELVHAKPPVTVHLLDHDPARHQQACNRVREEAWRTAVHMLDVVLTRAAARTEAVTAITTPPFDESFSLLMPLISFISSSSKRMTSSSSSSSSLHSPPVYIQNHGYSADATCRSVRTLVELGKASDLFDKLQECLKRYVDHIIQIVASASDSISVSTSDDSTDVKRELITFLHLAHAWGHYRLTVLELQEVWVFLDRWYIHRARAVRSIEGLAIELLKEAILQHPWLLQRAQVGYLEYLRQDFVHTSETRREMCLFTNLCLCIQVYFLRLEPEIINVASQFYTSVVHHMWEENITATVFYPQVERYLAEERERVQAGCIAEASLPRLEEAAQTSLLVEHGVGFLERDFAQLVQTSNYTCFSLAWKLLAMGKYVRLGKQCGAVFRQYMLREGAAIMRQLTSTSTTTIRRVEGEEYNAVKSMIALMCRGECVIEKGFAEDSVFFSVQLRDALAEALQENQTEFAEQLARYLDWTIRECENVPSANNNNDEEKSSHVITTSSSSHLTGNANTHSTLTSQLPTQTVSSSSAGVSSVGDTGSYDTRLKYIGRIYSLFPSKEIFESFYWVDLARRLLHYQRTPRIDIEESFIQCLKETCGADTSKFEGMINDVKTSLVLNERYQSWATERIAGEPQPWPPRMEIDNEEEEAAEVENEKAKQQQQMDRKRKRRNDNTEEEEEKEKEENDENEERDDEESAAILTTALASVDVKLHILTDNHWPKQTPLEIKLPQPLRALTRDVQNFYRHCFSDRRLIWQHQLSSAVVKCALGKVRRQLTGTLLQAAILLALQELIERGGQGQTSSVTVGVLCERLALDISLPDVVSSLLGLCHPKFRLVLRESANTNSSQENTSIVPPLAAEDRLQFNEDFSMSNMRCRIPLYGLRQRGGDTGTGADGLDNGPRRSADAVMADRSHVIEAAIVRFMKENHRVSHEDLFTTIPTLVRFTVAMPVMKKVVERLIERGFLERSGGTTYTYLS
ncbi:uncharacterized protein TM35_000332020 [Trypanosoma theileri]|uniref:Cullin family profile domain-containing protein n=1 Tax=Trypanosoma theileri TaxID=67003 RepID=A0A1X0NLZ9_9TRYP|nr:uncharacterized protein TM35_000332020 [Trypanosoma theileri]ORC85745.1 hypothetical protein TM35_000332020 [Trypanosoma theileri]